MYLMMILFFCSFTFSPCANPAAAINATMYSDYHQQSRFFASSPPGGSSVAQQQLLPPPPTSQPPVPSFSFVPSFPHHHTMTFDRSTGALPALPPHIDPPPVAPRSLEELLEFGWVNMANFALKDPEITDVASLLGKFNSLKDENTQLELKVRELREKHEQLAHLNTKLKNLRIVVPSKDQPAPITADGTTTAASSSSAGGGGIPIGTSSTTISSSNTSVNNQAAAVTHQGAPIPNNHHHNQWHHNSHLNTSLYSSSNHHLHNRSVNHQSHQQSNGSINQSTLSTTTTVTSNTAQELPGPPPSSTIPSTTTIPPPKRERERECVK